MADYKRRKEHTKETDLSGTDLTGTDLSGTDLTGTATVMLTTLWRWWLTVGDNFRMLTTELRSCWHLLDVGAWR